MAAEKPDSAAAREELQDRVARLESHVEQLQQTLATRTKNIWIGVGVSFAVFGGLLIIHWAGHLPGPRARPVHQFIIRPSRCHAVAMIRF